MTLPKHLKNKQHWDWPWPFSKIPRSWTAFDWGKPKLVAGNTTNMVDGHPKPIPNAGEWIVIRFPKAPFYWKWAAWGIAVTQKNGWHFRIGARWDDVDNYCQMPSFAIRKFPPETMERDTSTR